MAYVSFPARQGARGADLIIVAPTNGARKNQSVLISNLCRSEAGA